MKVGILKMSAPCYERFWATYGALFVPLKVEYSVARAIYTVECKSELFIDINEGYEIPEYVPMFKCINGVNIFVGFDQ